MWLFFKGKWCFLNFQEQVGTTFFEPHARCTPTSTHFVVHRIYTIFWTCLHILHECVFEYFTGTDLALTPILTFLASSLFSSLSFHHIYPFIPEPSVLTRYYHFVNFDQRFLQNFFLYFLYSAHSYPYIHSPFCSFFMFFLFSFVWFLYYPLYCMSFNYFFWRSVFFWHCPLFLIDLSFSLFPYHLDWQIVIFPKSSFSRVK